MLYQQGLKQGGLVVSGKVEAICRSQKGNGSSWKGEAAYAILMSKDKGVRRNRYEAFAGEETGFKFDDLFVIDDHVWILAVSAS